MQTRLLGMLALGLLLGGCGGSVTQDGQGTGGSGAGGAGAVPGTGATAGTGAVAGSGGFAGTGAVAGSGGYAGTGAVAGSGGSAGTAGGGGWPGCCSSDLDCPQYYDTGLSTECIAGVCKEVPPAGQCWDDADCYGGQCMGGSVCPCMADCFAADTLGWCTNGPSQCCATDAACNGGVCSNGVCKPKPPKGKCWDDGDCAAGACMGASVCPCMALCDGMDQLGTCMAPTPPPGACCKVDEDCGDYAWTPCVNGVCKMPLGGGYCWADAECPLGQKCIGASVCPCGALCALADQPGKCG